MRERRYRIPPPRTVTRTVLRIDGTASSVDLVAGSDAGAEQTTQALASLVQRGIVRLVLRAEPGEGQTGGKPDSDA